MCFMRALPKGLRSFGTDNGARLSAQNCIKKSEEFYRQHAMQRRYFYYIDLQGRLYLEDTSPKNIATSLKSFKFLRFFYANLKDNEKSSEFIEYPYCSPCGKEMNYIKCADRPIVFDDLSRDSEAWRLRYGGELYVPFDPSSLRVSVLTGRLYHAFVHKRSGEIWMGLIRSQLAVELSEHMEFKAEGVTGNHEEVVAEIAWEGKVVPLYSMK